MRRTLLASLIVALVVHTGCGRKADREADTRQPPPKRPAATMPSPKPVAEDLEIDVRLSSLPDRMALARQDAATVQLRDRQDPRRSVIVRVNHAYGPFDTDRYHLEARQTPMRYRRGSSLGSGQFEDAPFGPAAWSAWRYEEDGQMMQMVELMSPHPAGPGVLRLVAKYPEGADDATRQAAELRGLLDRIEAAG